MSQRLIHTTYSVAVLAGGDSPEREVSLVSGAQAVDALEAGHHLVETFDPAETPVEEIPWSRFDVCFLALHGGAGEDGRVQRHLESIGMPYTGSGPAASRLAMDKSAAKERFLQAGVPTLPWLVAPTESASELLAGRGNKLGYPVVVKPNAGGSSLGVGFAADHQQLTEQITESARYDDRVLIEPWIDGREFTVAVLGRRPLPVLEIATPRGLLDYESKYHLSTTECRFDTGLTTDKLTRLQAAAVKAASAVGTSGLVRVDLMLDQRERPWVLEVNTIPGLTPNSFAPKAAAQAGLDFLALCEWMLWDCLKTVEVCG